MKNAMHVVTLAALLSAGPGFANTVRMASQTPYAEDAEISEKVRSECVKLGEQLPAYTREFGAETGVAVELVDAVSKGSRGRVLMVEIVDAVSMGNAFIGHQKYARIQGTLFQDGKKVAGFKARRNSMGGAFGAYKGSCSVLGRTMKALGKDVADWLKNPSDGARLGDM